jgi:hypothetical protein
MISSIVILLLARVHSGNHVIEVDGGQSACAARRGGLFLDAGTSVDVGCGIHDSLVALNSNGWGTDGGISISGGVGKTVTVSYYPA